MIQEKSIHRLPGFLAAVIHFLVFVSGAVVVTAAALSESTWTILGLLIIVAAALCMGGYTIVSPNEAMVVTFFGNYIGSVKEPGFWWVNPLTLKRRVSLRIRNFESGRLKVNDKEGNPIEIAAIVVWRVVETAEAIFNVDSYENYVQVQSEAAVRNLAVSYPYDSHEDGVISLRGTTQEISEKLKSEVQDRLSKAGVEVIEARLSHLAYAAEIASAMLRRQQANAIIAARQRIVEGAVSMVEMALDKLDQGGRVKLDRERRAAMVSNLLVVLTSDRDAQPVVNTGTLYN